MANGDFTEIPRLEGGPVVGVSAHHESGVMGLTEVGGDKEEAGKDVEARHDILAETVAGLDMNDIVGDAGDGGGDALPLNVAGGDGFLGFGFGLLVGNSRVSGLRFLWRVLAGPPQGAGEGDDRAEKAEDSKESGASEDGFAIFPEGVRNLLEWM